MSIRSFVSKLLLFVPFASMLLCIASCGGGGGSGDDGEPGTIHFREISLDAREGSIINILVARSGGSSGVARVDFTTADGSAVAGSDYTAAEGTLTWSDGVSGNKTISVTIPDDNGTEFTESFAVTLNNVSGASLDVNSSVTVEIIDNDTAVHTAFGSITELSSATVNGIRYDTDEASVIVNGSPAAVSDLKLGQVVMLEGEVNFSSALGSAVEIQHNASVIGPLEDIDSLSRQLIVMDQIVLTDADTVFDPSIDPDTFAGLALGETVQVSGFRNAEGGILATRIETDTTSTGVQLIGTVAGLDLVSMLFTVNGLSVDYSALISPHTLENGQLVMVRGVLNLNGILQADEIATVVNTAVTPGGRVHLGGVVTRFISSIDFDLNGFMATIDSNTSYFNGTAGDLQANAQVTIDGEVSANGDSILARLVTFGQPDFSRTTQMFDFVSFNKIEVNGFADVTVNQGTDYSIAVTADEDLVSDVDVTQNGDTVSFDLTSSQLYSVVVTLPILTRIDIGDNALANVMLKDFDQSQMTVNVGGVSVVRSEGVSIDELTATLSGVSVLDFGDTQPIASAQIDINGVSQATLNMTVGSALAGSVRTGEGTGVSRLYYYGTDVMENVTTDALSMVTWLGETQP
ncbi:MAG: DUF5666 domain-containing protein [Candidatus Thiodiazotropha sp.]